MVGSIKSTCQRVWYRLFRKDGMRKMIKAQLNMGLVRLKGFSPLYLDQ